VRLMQLGAGHTSGDIVAWVPDAEVMFSGDLIEYHSACYCGDAHLREWPATLDEIRAFNPKAIAPGRGDALKGIATGREAIAMTRDFVTTLYGAAEGLTSATRKCGQPCKEDDHERQHLARNHQPEFTQYHAGLYVRLRQQF
jgi:glyoxylase-like metal-dependent hydrolase (beta-lactamase superfamily II)